MKAVLKIFAFGYLSTVFFFFLCGVALLGFAANEIWHALNPMNDTEMRDRFVQILEAIGLLTISVAAFELGQTILEEEVQRNANMSAPTRVRRFVSRFMVVVIVSLSIECLVAVFQLVHKSPELLPHAATIGLAAAVLFAAWGWFIRENVAAEKLEPQAMQEAKAEDHKIENHS